MTVAKLLIFRPCSHWLTFFIRCQAGLNTGRQPSSALVLGSVGLLCVPGVPWVSYFTGDGVAFHGTYWHNDYGVPHSHGCINMSPQAAKWLYRWTTPSVPTDKYFYADDKGTRVVIQ